MKRQEFMYTFQITRTVIFEVNYYTLGENKSAHFSTSADVFNRPKTDFNRCGQCQNEVLTGYAHKFWAKWDKHHGKDLNDNDYKELLQDIEELKSRYNYIDTIRDTFAGTHYRHSFYNQKELSMQPLKKVK